MKKSESLLETIWSNRGKLFLSTLLFFCLSSALAQWTQPIYINTSGADAALGFFGASGTGNAGIYFDGSNGDFVGSDYASLLQMDDLSVQLSSSGNNPIFFKTVNTTRMTISGNGKVGIGTDAPSHTFDVNAGPNQIHAQFTGSYAGQQGIQVRRSGGADIKLLANYTSFGGGLQSSSALRFSVNANSLLDPALIIQPSGSVGIGTTSTGNYKLAIHASDDYYSLIKLSNNANALSGIQIGNVSRVSNDAEIWNWENGYFRIATNNAERLRIASNGNVGIGTPSPDFLLDVSRANHNVARFVSTGTNSGPDVLIVDADNTSTRASLQIQGNGGTIESLFVGSTGNVGIGTTTPDTKLTVKGSIHSEEVKVDLSVPGPDYVFEENYDLRSLEETEAYIKENKHLPEIPSAKEMEANGVELGEMNMLLLKKIEELTLHQIEMMKIIKLQQEEINKLKED